MRFVFGVTAMAAVSHAVRQVRHNEGNVQVSQEQRTVTGCTCKNQCGGGLGLTDKSKCDTCKTKDGCGRFSVTGRYDYCDYSEGSFDQQSADRKENYYRQKLLQNTKRTPKFENPLGNFVTSMMTVFDNYMPEMPAGRKKLIHSIGSVCQFKLDVKSGSPFTGLFASGEQRGFIRMGSAADIDKNEGVTPGIGIKMLRNGIHSGDFVLLHSLELGQGYNFFKWNMSNHIGTADGLTTAALAKKFEQASQCSPQVGLSDMARYSRDGSEHNPPKFPFKVVFVPSRAVQSTDKPKKVDQVHDEMADFPIGTTLYTAWGCGSPEGDESNPTASCGAPFELGNVITTSKCQTSKYGDEAFHIRHQRIEEDWRLEPTFLQSGSYSAQKACGRKGSVSAAGAPAPCNLQGMLDNDA